ncbi:MAG: cobalamin-5-phosphate synthase [Tardiphaga sp.]|jgi:adenosylcobinamide-GDP ribazoletransferase|nr:cobalamin-5-phosphate synthase [Tardiphaga sp.]
MSEAGHFWNALRFLTVIPAPNIDRVEDDWLIRAAKYFPLIGIIVGGFSAGVLLLAGVIWTGLLPPLLAVAAGTVLTGALHEDGLADTADGFGGGRSRDTRLVIMKDSRIGTYGALALGFSVALRVVALAALPLWIGAAALIAAHAGGRFAAAAAMSLLPYAGDPAATKLTYTEASLRRSEVGLAVIFVLVASLPLARTGVFAALIGLLLGAALATWLAGRAQRLIGGYTGDVLGATEQLFEVGLLLGVAAILNV